MILGISHSDREGFFNKSCAGNRELGHHFHVPSVPKSNLYSNVNYDFTLQKKTCLAAL